MQMQGNSESAKSSTTEYETISEPTGFDGLGVVTVTEALTNGNKRKKRKNKYKKHPKISSEGLDLEGSGHQYSESLSVESILKPLCSARYFDPPKDSGFSSRNCGEVSHREVNCTEPKRTRPCYVCGTYEHNWKRCKLRRKCVICKERGHRIKDCPDKKKGVSNSKPSSSVCLRCGVDSGHDMFSCCSDYCLDDIKNIQCYICKLFGHLCCVDLQNSSPVAVSCYSCGQPGHLGCECLKVHEGGKQEVRFLKISDHVKVLMHCP